MTSQARRESIVRPQDVALLATLSREPNLVKACATLGISRDRGFYALERMGRIAGGPVVSTRRGGDGGSTTLTSRGRTLLGAGVGASDLTSSHQSTVLEGTWHARPAPHVTLPDGPDLFVSFQAEEGGAVTISVDPEAVIVARKHYPTSARNVLRGRVHGLHRDKGVWNLEALVGNHTFVVALTAESVKILRLRRGVTAWLYLKATAIHRLGGPDPGRARQAVPRGR